MTEHRGFDHKGMRVLSLFSGIGGLDLGLERTGMEVVAQVEIDPQCRRVLAHHWPDVARYEDVRDVGVGRTEHHIEGEQDDAQARESVAPWRVGDVDLVCGGFPCQDLSVAGRRAGLDGARSGLWFEFQRVVSELRPAYVLVENVPGLLSSNQGRDFAIVLNGLGELGYAVSWAVLDARHFGVAQRRRRVFVVAGPDPGRTEAILALAEGCGGHPPAGRAAGEGVSAGVGDGVANPLGAKRDGGWRGDNDTYIPEIVPQALSSKWAKGSSGLAGDEAANIIAVRTAHTGAPVADLSEGAAYTLDSTQGQAVAHTLRADGFDASEDGTGRGVPLVVVQEAQTGVREYDTVGSLRSDAPGSQPTGTLIRRGVTVRRLTPIECSRLQGFPDDWLDGLGLADGPKYRMLGNAVCVPVAEWIGFRMRRLTP